jgi:hypothetical protein
MELLLIKSRKVLMQIKFQKSSLKRLKLGETVVDLMMYLFNKEVISNIWMLSVTSEILID